MNAEYRIYATYLESHKIELYFNQIKEYTKLSNSSLQNILQKLMEKNILKVNKTKSNTFYKIHDKKYFAMKFSELAYKKFKSLKANVRLPLENFMEKVPKDILTIVLFGSVAIKKEKKGSDIDLLIVYNQDFDFDSIVEEINAISNFPLNIFHCYLKDFNENKDPIIQQARKKGFPIFHEQIFYEALLDGFR